MCTRKVLLMLVSFLFFGVRIDLSFLSCFADFVEYFWKSFVLIVFEFHLIVMSVVKHVMKFLLGKIRIRVPKKKRRRRLISQYSAQASSLPYD